MHKYWRGKAFGPSLPSTVRGDARVRWLTTIPGIGMYSAMLPLAEIGDIRRFRDKQALCSYAGRLPRVRESAGKAARGGITREGSPWLRWIMVEAAQVEFAETEFTAV